MKKDIFTNLAIGILVACAVALTSIRILEAVGFTKKPRENTQQQEIAVSDWRKYAAPERRVGAEGARIQIVEFSDFQCPACAAFQKALASVLPKFGAKIALTYRHYPLTSTHPAALNAALASECAREQGSFDSMRDVLFEKQSVLGTVPWDSLVRDAGVADVLKFHKCMESNKYLDLIRSDTIAAQELGVAATPSFLVNDRMYRGAPNSEQLETLLANHLDRKAK